METSESVLPAPIRYELGDSHTYEFVEGTVPHPMAPGMFKTLQTAAATQKILSEIQKH